MNELIFGFFVFGVTYLIRHTNGLGDCFLKLRCMLGQQHEVEVFWPADKNGEYVEKVKNRTELPVPEYAPWYTKLVDCFWCLSTWVAGISIIFYPSIAWDMKFFTWLASVGFAGMIYTILQNGEK